MSMQYGFEMDDSEASAVKEDLTTTKWEIRIGSLLAFSLMLTTTTPCP
jgi:hypothetical protein